MRSRLNLSSHVDEQKLYRPKYRTRSESRFVAFQLANCRGPSWSRNQAFYRDSKATAYCQSEISSVIRLMFL